MNKKSFNSLFTYPLLQYPYSKVYTKKGIIIPQISKSQSASKLFYSATLYLDPDSPVQGSVVPKNRFKIVHQLSDFNIQYSTQQYIYSRNHEFFPERLGRGILNAHFSLVFWSHVIAGGSIVTNRDVLFARALSVNQQVHLEVNLAWGPKLLVQMLITAVPGLFSVRFRHTAPPNTPVGDGPWEFSHVKNKIKKGS